MNEVFDTWCEEEGIRQHISKKRLFAALRDMGVTVGGKSGLDRYWSGLRFRNEHERIAAQTRSGKKQILPRSFYPPPPNIQSRYGGL